MSSTRTSRTSLSRQSISDPSSEYKAFPIPIPGYDVYRFGPFDDVDKGEFRAGPGPSQAFWSRTGAPATLTDPDKAIFAVALMENDDGDAETLRGIIKGLVGGSVLAMSISTGTRKSSASSAISTRGFEHRPEHRSSMTKLVGRRNCDSPARSWHWPNQAPRW